MVSKLERQKEKLPSIYFLFGLYLLKILGRFALPTVMINQVDNVISEGARRKAS